MSCVACGSELPDGARFCPRCGTEQTAPSEERKLVSVLFVDIVGSTARADGADPEDVRDRNQLYFNDARARIERYGGVVEKYIGDAVMAVFGAPLAKADDAERAVQAALSIIEGSHELNLANPGLDLQLRGAVCTGEAVVAIDAAPSEPLATGDVANTASRLQNAAPPGGVLIGQQTYELVRHAFELDPLEPIEAKGKREPVAAWRVIAPLAAGARPVSATPFVGRDNELEILLRVWDRAVDASRPHLVTVLGPAGIGKTRLARELSAHVDGSGGIALWGRSLPYEERSPYRAAGQIVRKVADIYENDGVDVARDKLSTAVGSLFPEPDAADTTRYLSVVLGLGVDEPPDEVVHLQFAARMFLEHLAARAPILVVFEDVHWADEPLLDLIAYLVSHVRDAQVVFLALARPEFLESGRTWGGGMTGQTTLPLDPLTSADAAVVAAALLPDQAAGAVERVVAVGGGNPLFLEELAASVTDEAGLEELPTTVLAAIAARIDALPANARSVLLHASVIGATFWRDVLGAVMPQDGASDALDTLEDRGLIVRHLQSTVAGDTEYSFKHALIHDGAYGTMPRAARRELHGAIAAYLEDVVAGRPDLGWLLAHHWTEAGDPARAIGYLLAAAERAEDALAEDEAYDLLTRAIDLTEDEAERRRIRLRRGAMLSDMGDYARADEALTALLPDLDGREEVEALLALAKSTHWTEQMDRTREVSERALTLARDGGFSDLEPIALSLHGASYAMRGGPGDVDRALQLGDLAIDLWPEGEHQPELAHHLHIHANPNYWRGRYQETYDLSMQIKSMGGELSPNSAAMVLRGAGMIGLALAGLGRYEEALAASDAAIATARILGRPANVVLNYSTLILREVFALEEARERSAGVADRLGPSDFNMPWMNARADLITTELLLGSFGAVERSWQGTWDDAQDTVAWEHWLVSGRLAWVRGELALGTGQLEEAVTWSSRALEMARSGGRPKYEALALTALGRALTRQGLAEEAVGELTPAVRIADELGTPLLRWETRAALSSAERASGSDPESSLAEAASIINDVVSSLSPDRAATYLAAPSVRAVLDA